MVWVLRGGGYVAQEVLLIFDHLRADKGVGMLKDLACEAGKSRVSPYQRRVWILKGLWPQGKQLEVG